jgi:hypothetical protein
MCNLSDKNMADIQFAIEGDGAVEATGELLALQGIEGSYSIDADVQREGTLATIAVIVGIASGVAAIAEMAIAK